MGIVSFSIFFAIVADSVYRSKYEKPVTRDEDDDLREPVDVFVNWIKTAGYKAVGFGFYRVLSISPSAQKFFAKRFLKHLVDKNANGHDALQNDAMASTGLTDPGTTGLFDMNALGDAYSESSDTDEGGMKRPGRKELMR